MKKIIYILLILVVIIGVVVLVNRDEDTVLPIYDEQNNDVQNEENNEDDEELTPEEEQTLVITYIEENISDLSPEEEVLGGTFRVTNITFNEDNSGTVEYEDGHIALIADFTYTIDDGGVEVSLSNVRD